MKNNCGILLTNIGTPDAPTTKAVRRYLSEFLSDSRVIELPRIIWQPILHGIILRFRPKKSAALYQRIWRPEGSPLLHYSQAVARALQKKLNLPVALGMHYGNPSIKQALHDLRQQRVEKIIVLPLFPQYSATTTGSAFDRATWELQKWRNIPEITFLRSYATHPDYINCLSASIRNAWQTKGKPQHLLFSFHSIPEKYAKAGDPYQEECYATAELVAKELELAKDFWSVAFQSRIGATKWLSPYTDHVLEKFPAQGIKKIQVICPGFAVDCLETLEEIALRGQEQFCSAGGEEFYYIPALNDQAEHIDALARII